MGCPGEADPAQQELRAESSWGGQGSCSEPAHPSPGCTALPWAAPWDVTAPGPAGLGQGLSAVPPSDVVGEMLHIPAPGFSSSTTPLLFPCGFHTKMLLCFVLPHHLIGNQCLSSSLTICGAAAELWAWEPSLKQLGLGTCVQKTGATNVGIPPQEAGGKGPPVPVSHRLSGACAADTDFLQDLQTSA